MAQQTPKEKATELIDKYINDEFNCKDCDMPFCDMKCTILSNYEAKQCALIAIDEILDEHMFDDSDYANRRYKYWQQVKQEIKNL